MKMNILPAVAVAVVLSLFTFSGTSCLGPKVDDLALFEPAQLAWSEVKSDLEAGYSDGENAGDLTLEDADTLRGHTVELGTAIREKDRDGLRLVPWPTMYPWALRGIDAQLAEGQIGPGVAESFRVHDGKFDEIMQRLRGTTQ